MNFHYSAKVFKNNLLKKENIYFLVLILLIFFLDRYSKNLILNNFSETRFYINDFLNFDLTWNTGIGFGLLSSDLEIIYNSITFLIGAVIFILFYLSMISAKLDKLIYGIIIGGALGNFYDRLQYKAVPDFIDLHYNNFHWFTFNVSDVFISFGVIVFILKGFYEKN
tara:strand:- start:146 stop:646 length:501 start_codon:yes stop_codon:yes gene_type:complete